MNHYHCGAKSTEGILMQEHTRDNPIKAGLQAHAYQRKKPSCATLSIAVDLHRNDEAPTSPMNALKGSTYDTNMRAGLSTSAVEIPAVEHTAARHRDVHLW